MPMPPHGAVTPWWKLFACMLTVVHLVEVEDGAGCERLGEGKHHDGHPK